MNLEDQYSSSSIANPSLAAITYSSILNPPYCVKNRFKNIIKAPV